MVNPSLPTVFSLSEELTLGSYEQLSCYIIPFILFSEIPKFFQKILDYFYQENFLWSTPASSLLFFFHNYPKAFIFDRQR